MQGAEQRSAPCKRIDKKLSKDALKDVQCAHKKGTERLSVRPCKALNVMQEGTERSDKKALNEVQSNDPVNNSYNRSIDGTCPSGSAQACAALIIRKLELPSEIPDPVWAMWCAYRESRLPDVDWDLNLARASLNTLSACVANGDSAQKIVERTIKRHGVKLCFLRKRSLLVQAPFSSANGLEWWKSSLSIMHYGQRLNLKQFEDESFPEFKFRVFKGAGPGPWIDAALLQAKSESAARYEELRKYFGCDIDERPKGES